MIIGGMMAHFAGEVQPPRCTSRVRAASSSSVEPFEIRSIRARCAPSRPRASAKFSTTLALARLTVTDHGYAHEHTMGTEGEKSEDGSPCVGSSSWPGPVQVAGSVTGIPSPFPGPALPEKRHSGSFPAVPPLE